MHALCKYKDRKEGGIEAERGGREECAERQRSSL